MRPGFVNLLAVIGGCTVLATGLHYGVRTWGDHAATGVVSDSTGRAVAKVPVFLDRGGVIERYVTDANGRFRLPLEPAERERAVWLICAANSVPMVGHTTMGQIGGTSYQLNGIEPPAKIAVRGFGWRGPIPHECTLADPTVLWRGPATSAGDGTPAQTTEPDWATYRGR